MAINKATVVLVHGGLGRRVELGEGDRAAGGERRQGGCAPLPLTPSSDDVAALDRTLERVRGRLSSSATPMPAGLLGRPAATR